MYFKDVAQEFQEIEITQSRLEKTQKLAALLSRASDHEAAAISYLSLGELYPPYKSVTFNIAEKKILPLVALICNLNEDEMKAQLKEVADAGTLIAQCKKKEESSITVLEMHEALCALATTVGGGSVERKTDALYALLHKVGPLEAKYVIRIVLGTLRLGFSDMTLIDAVSWMLTGDKSGRAVVEDAYNRCADIGKIVMTAKQGGLEALSRMHTVVGIPIRPAAAERLATIEDVMQKLGRCVAQPKLDGLRLQIHIDKPKGKISIFSRNLQDVSSMFPDLVTQLKKLDVQTLICEGEAISWDPDTGIFLPFQETAKRKRKHGVEQAAQEYPLKLFLFDLLYLNGVDYLNMVHEERRTRLSEILQGMSHDIVQIIDEKKIESVEQLRDYFIAVIDAGLEGLVVKRPNAIYQPGKRNFNWIKLKRHNSGQLEDTIDAVIVGYYHGKGKRSQFGIGAFLTAIYNPQDDCYETVAKVGTGLTDVEWKVLKERCDAHKVAVQPYNVRCVKELYPDVWIDPAIICALRADEITVSPLHWAGRAAGKLGYALRFPRMVGYRNDKGLLDVTTANEIKQLYALQYGVSEGDE